MEHQIQTLIIDATMFVLRLVKWQIDTIHYLMKIN